MLEPVLTLALALYLGALALAGFRAWRRSGLALPAALRRFFSPPTYGTEEEVRRLHMLLPLLHQGLLVALAVGLFLAWQWGAGGWSLALLAVWLATGYLGLYVLLRRGQVRLVSRLLPLVAFVIVTLVLTLARGFHGAAVSAYCIVLVAAALLQSSRAVLFYAALSIALVSGVYGLEAVGLFDLSGATSPAQALAIYLGTFVSLAMLLRQGTRALEEGRRHTRRLQLLQAEQARQLDEALQVERKRTRQQELLNDFARTLTSLNDPPDLMRAATRRVGEAFGFEAAALYLVDDDRFQLAAVAGLFAAGRTVGATLTPGVGVAGWVAAHDQTCWLDRPAADERFVAEPGPALAGVVAVPLRLAKSLVGVLEVATTRAGVVDASDVRAVESLADLLVAGLQTSQLFIQLRQRQQLTEALRRVGAAVNASLDLPTVLDTICAETQAAFAADMVEVWLEDWPVPLRRLARSGALVGSDAAASPADTAAYIDTALRAGRHLITNLAALADLPAHRAYFGCAQSLILAPLRKEGRVFGALVIAEAERPRRLTAEDAAAAELLGAQLATAVDNARLYAAHRRRADELALLNDITRAALVIGDVQHLTETLAERMGELIGADGCYLTRWDEARQVAEPVTASSALRADYLLRRPTPPPGQPSLTQAVLAAGRAVAVPDVRQSPYFQPEVALQFPTRALLGVPLLAGGQPLGAALLAFNTPHTFTLDEIATAEQAGRQLALALARVQALETERRRGVQLTLLSAVSQQVADTLEESVLLQRTTAAMVNTLGFAEAAILVPTGDDELQVVALSKTELMVVEVGFVQKLGTGVIGQTAATRTTYVTNDVGRDPYYFDPGGRGVGSAIGLPLLREGELLGVLYIETSVPNAFTPVDVVAFETLARHVATAMQNARLFAAARQRLDYLTALQSVSHEIAASLELDRIIDNVVHLLNTTFGYRYVSLYVLERDVLRLKAQVGYPEELIIHAVPVERGVSGRTVRTRQTQFIGDVSTDPDFLQALYSVRSEICVPLLTETAVLGVLNVESGPDRALTAADVSLLTALAGQVTVAMVNAQLYEAERDQRQLTETLRAASLALSTSLDFEQVMDGLLVHVAQIVPYDAGCVILIEGGWTRHARQRGYDQFGAAVDEGTQAISLEVATTPNLAQLIHSGQPLIIPDTVQYPGWKRVPGTPHLRAWIGVPIMAQGETLALFSLEKREAGSFTPEHARRLTAMAGQVALALQNARLYAAQRRRSEAQRLLLLAARDLSAGLSQAAVLAATARHMTTGLQNDGCTIYSWERDHNRLVTLLDYARDSADRLGQVGNTHALADYPLTRRVLEARQPVTLAVDDPAADPAEVAVMRAFGLGHLLLLPLFNGEEVFGLIEVNRHMGRPPFADSDVQLAQSLAAQAAVALDNARLHTAVQENLRELNALLKANAALLSTLELEPLLQNILGAAIEAVPSAQKGTVILADATGAQLQIRAVQGYTDPRMLGLTFSREQGFSGRALRENRPLLINDVAAQRDPHLALVPVTSEMAAIGSAVVAPLAPKGHAEPAYGVISLDAAGTHAFTEADLRVLVAFANAAAVAIDNARLHAEVQRLAVTDSLTGLANPRAFDQALLTEFHRASRYGYALSLVIMDIDSFKQFNDTYGHPAGNERLKGIAAILRANVRDPDLPVRYGGEEFALLLPHTTKGGALALAERIRVAAEAAAPATEPRGGPISGYSLSLGVATYPLDALTIEELLVAADNAELQAKRRGKNQVVAALLLPGAPPD